MCALKLREVLAETQETQEGSTPTRARPVEQPVEFLVERALELLRSGKVYQSLKLAGLLRGHSAFAKYEEELKRHIDRKMEEFKFVDVNGLFPDILYVIAGARYKNFLFYGPPNTGKSYTITLIKEILNVPDDRFFIVHPDLTRRDFKSNVVEPGLRHGDTEPLLSEIGRALDLAAKSSPDEPPVILVFEEVDQFPRGVLKQGNPFFEPIRKVHVTMYGRTLKWEVPADKLLVFGTFNATGDHLGGDKTEALISRWHVLKFPEIPREKKIEIVKLNASCEQRFGNLVVRTRLSDPVVEALVNLMENVNARVRNAMGLTASPLTLRDVIKLADTLILTRSLDILKKELVSRVLYRMAPGITVTEERLAIEERTLQEDVNNILGVLTVNELVVTEVIYDGEVVATIGGGVVEREEEKPPRLLPYKAEPVRVGNDIVYLDLRMMNLDDKGIPVMFKKPKNSVWDVRLRVVEEGALISGGTCIHAKAEGIEGSVYDVFIVLDGKGIGVSCNCPSYVHGLNHYLKSGTTGEMNVPCKHVVRLLIEAKDAVLDHLVAINCISPSDAEEIKRGKKLSEATGSVIVWAVHYLKTIIRHMYSVKLEEAEIGAEDQS